MDGGRRNVERGADRGRVEHAGAIVVDQSMDWKASLVNRVRDVRSGITPEWKGIDNKVGEQPWPQLVRCASICCRVCSCIFQEDGIVVRSTGKEWYID